MLTQMGVENPSNSLFFGYNKGMDKKAKKMLSVIKWPNGFVNIVRLEGEQDGAMLESEINMIVDDMVKRAGIPREDVAIRLFNVSEVEIKDKL